MKNLLLSIALLASAGSAVGEEVTVSSTGAGNFTSINAAVAALKSDDPTPGIITILDNGPFNETWIVLNEGISATGTTYSTKSLTMRAAPGIRPVVIVNTPNDGAIYIRKVGEPLTIEDLVLIPPAGDPATAPQAAIKIDNIAVPEPGIDDISSVTLRNITIASNDGFNNPVGSLDGLTTPVITASTVSFRDEGIFLPSYQRPTTHKRFIYMYDCVITGLNGSSGSDGIRSQSDGAAGSEIVVGPGCVISHNNTILTPSTNGALQPGGNNGGLVFRVEGTQENPVKLINNNYNGITITGTDTPGQGFTSCKWTIIANNTSNAILSNDPNTLTTAYENVTMANNGGSVLTSRVTYNSALTFKDVIAAGSGDPAGVENFISTINFDLSTPVGTAGFNNSAIVLVGPYTLNNTLFDQDGLEDPTPTNVFKTAVISADPQFVSLDPASPQFAQVSNPAYGAAGTGGQPLVGGGSFAAASVSDWQLF